MRNDSEAKISTYWIRENDGVVTAALVMPNSKPARCHRCKHRVRFDNGTDTALFLCMSQPYEEDDDYGIVTWLDTADFESGECLNFKEA